VQTFIDQSCGLDLLQPTKGLRDSLAILDIIKNIMKQFGNYTQRHDKADLNGRFNDKLQINYSVSNGSQDCRMAKVVVTPIHLSASEHKDGWKAVLLVDAKDSEYGRGGEDCSKTSTKPLTHTHVPSQQSIKWHLGHSSIMNSSGSWIYLIYTMRTSKYSVYWQT
jgi:hypothetical protein